MAGEQEMLCKEEDDLVREMLEAVANLMRLVAVDADDIIACQLMALFKRVMKKVPGAEEDMVKAIIGEAESKRIASTASRSVSVIFETKISSRRTS